MTVIVITLLSIPAAQASAPGGADTLSGVPGAQRPLPRVAGVVPSGVAEPTSSGRVTAKATPETHACVPNTRRAIVSRRAATWHWQDKLGIFRTRTARRARATTSCAYLHWIKGYWARGADRHYRSWVASFTVLDFPYEEGDAWTKAVNQADRLYPGTRGWLLSCSTPEGGHGRWVVHGGGSYYSGAEYAKGGKEVGGNMQYTYGTFAGHFRHAAEDLIARGYRLPVQLRRSSVTAWRAAAAQALAAAWARATGNDNQHWIASWATGCR